MDGDERRETRDEKGGILGLHDCDSPELFRDAQEAFVVSPGIVGFALQLFQKEAGAVFLIVLCAGFDHRYLVHHEGRVEAVLRRIIMDRVFPAFSRQRNISASSPRVLCS